MININDVINRPSQHSHMIIFIKARIAFDNTDHPLVTKIGKHQVERGTPLTKYKKGT